MDNFQNITSNVYHLLVHNNQPKIKTQVNQDNCLIHKIDGFCIHHWSHSHLRLLYKVCQLCKNPHLQQLHHNNNLCLYQIQIMPGNCLIHIWDLLDIGHQSHSHLQVLNKNDKHRIQLFHWLHLYNWLKINLVCFWGNIFISLISLPSGYWHYRKKYW